MYGDLPPNGEAQPCAGKSVVMAQLVGRVLVRGSPRFLRIGYSACWARPSAGFVEHLYAVQVGDEIIVARFSLLTSMPKRVSQCLARDWLDEECSEGTGKRTRESVCFPFGADSYDAGFWCMAEECFHRGHTVRIRQCEVKHNQLWLVFACLRNCLLRSSSQAHDFEVAIKEEELCEVLAGSLNSINDEGT
jgi:hypothetical protein